MSEWHAIVRPVKNVKDTKAERRKKAIMAAVLQGVVDQFEAEHADEINKCITEALLTGRFTPFPTFGNEHPASPHQGEPG